MDLVGYQEYGALNFSCMVNIAPDLTQKFSEASETDEMHKIIYSGCDIFDGNCSASDMLILFEANCKVELKMRINGKIIQYYCFYEMI